MMVQVKGINLIYCLVNWLNLCGLKLRVEVSNDPDKISNNITEENKVLTANKI